MSENSEHNVEIYRQRYETYRYLDRLFWQMFQIAIGAIAIVAAILKIGQAEIVIPLMIIGALWVFIGGAMMKQRSGIRANYIALKKAADAIGDQNLPIPQKNGVSDVIAKVIMFLGVASFFGGLIYYWCTS